MQSKAIAAWHAKNAKTSVDHRSHADDGSMDARDESSQACSVAPKVGFTSMRAMRAHLAAPCDFNLKWTQNWARKLCMDFRCELMGFSYDETIHPLSDQTQ